MIQQGLWARVGVSTGGRLGVTPHVDHKAATDPAYGEAEAHALLAFSKASADDKAVTGPRCWQVQESASSKMHGVRLTRCDFAVLSAGYSMYMRLFFSVSTVLLWPGMCRVCNVMLVTWHHQCVCVCSSSVAGGRSSSAANV